MEHQRIRPSLADLANLDLDAPAFPEWETSGTPAVTVSRTRPPTISTSVPPPVPRIPTDSSSFEPSQDSAADAAAPRPAKPKSRFALQREKEAAERFQIDLDDEPPTEPPDSGALPRATPRFSLVKDVFEKPASERPTPPTAPGPSRLSNFRAGSRGFPPLGKGVFPGKAAVPSPRSPPLQQQATAGRAASFDADKLVDGGSVEGLMQSVSQENETVVQGMSEAQILEEQRQIREEMGLSEGMIKMLQERAQRRTRPTEPTVRARPAAPASTRQPARPPPNVFNDDDDEEGTPEYIRKHFFPNEPVNPALEWMNPQSVRPNAGSSTGFGSIAYDLQGKLVENLDDQANAAPPTENGEHHVSSSSTFTIPSLLALAASSVPSQRSTAFTTLLRILRYHSQKTREWEGMRQQCVQKASWALRDPSRNVIIAAIDLLDHLFATEARSNPYAPEVVLENAEVPKTLLSSFEASDPFPPLALHLSLGSLPRSTLLQLLGLLENLVDIARLANSPIPIDSILSTPKLLESIVDRFIATRWPVARDTDGDLPTPVALAFLGQLARSSRLRAKELVKRNLIESTLRYLAVPPWELEDSTATQKLGQEMLEGVFDLWQVLARYGIGCELRTQAAPLLEGVFERIRDRTIVEGDDRWFKSLLRLLQMWTVAAIDPHVTGHDIVWSQVEGWRDVAVEAYETYRADLAIVADSWRLLTSWLEGSKVNKSWRGEKEREWVQEEFGHEFAQGGQAREMVQGAMERLGDDDVRVISAALLLSEAYEESSNPPTPALFDLDPSFVQTVVDTILSQASPRPDQIRLVLLLLPRVATTHVLPTILRVLPRLSAQDAVAARDLISRVLQLSSTHATSTSGLDPDLELPALVDAPLLNPFYTHSIVQASGGRVIGPDFPSSRDLKLTASLAPFSPADPILKPDWPLSVLDELLRSSSSAVFKQLPSDWDASELQLVKTCLALTRVVFKLNETDRPDPAVLVYDLMKVFMLEKDADPQSLETDLFRHPSVQCSLSALFEPLRISSSTARPIVPRASVESTLEPPLERVSGVVSTAPFYQLYTDFLGLYDSISLSNPLFGLCLLPPLSQLYPNDYRRLLWTDYSHLLKTLRFEPHEVISDVANDGVSDSRLSTWFYPRETNETMLKAYVDAVVSDLVKRHESPFLYWIAVHHVALSVFASEDDRKVRENLVKTLVHRGKPELVDLVKSYEQGGEGQELRSFEECTGGEVPEDKMRTWQSLAGVA
ncbi:uncharacterized protein JCM15063_004625 [Sporobolomyces koalae]|uniref:uncharacterized protein n=1 Tax=Sporobolomyces koalae TaxID=500713 RepID=UPI0031808774